MRLSRKMYLGFSIIIGLVIIQATLSVRDLQAVRDRIVYLADEYLPETILAGEVRYEVAMAGYHMRAFSTSLNERDYNAGVERLRAVDKAFGDLKELKNRQRQLAGLSGYVSALDPDISVSTTKYAGASAARRKSTEPPGSKSIGHSTNSNKAWLPCVTISMMT